MKMLTAVTIASTMLLLGCGDGIPKPTDSDVQKATINQVQKFFKNESAKYLVQESMQNMLFGYAPRLQDTISDFIGQQKSGMPHFIWLYRITWDVFGLVYGGR